MPIGSCKKYLVDTLLVYKKSKINFFSRILWKEEPKTVIAPYTKIKLAFSIFLSTTGLVKPCGNLPRLCGKAKYL